MWQKFQVFDEPRLTRNPALLISVSTSNPQYQILYSQARELANFLLEKNIGFSKFATLYSSAMPAMVNISNDGLIELPSCSFFLRSGGERDVVLFAGYSSPVADEYEFAHLILTYAQKLGVKEVISIGARWAESPISPLETPALVGFSTDLEGADWLKKNGVIVLSDETAFYFTNLIIALSPRYGMRGYKISVNHGEPKPHPKTLIAMLGLLSKMLDFSLNTSELETRAKELAATIKARGLTVPIEGEETIESEQKGIYR